MSTRENKSNKSLYIFLFIVYCLTMLWLLFGRSRYHIDGDYHVIIDTLVNLQPLRTIRAYTYVLENRVEAYLWVAAYNLFGNILLFIPYGVFLPGLFKGMRKFWKTMLLGIVTIVFVELTQIITLRGSCDIDDLILNTIGIFIGYIMYRLTHLKRE